MDADAPAAPAGRRQSYVARTVEQLETRLEAAMRSVPARKLVRVLGGLVALATALSIPVGYAIFGHLKEAEMLTFRAELTAARLAVVISKSDADWQFDTAGLRSAVDLSDRLRAPVARRVLDARGTALLTSGAIVQPALTRGAPIVVGGDVVGRVELTASLLPLLTNSALMGVLTLVLGAVAYLIFAVLPLKVLDRTLGELRQAGETATRQNLLLDTALENMVQGLAMFDADERIVIANDRYAQLYGLQPDQVLPGTTLRRVVELRHALGHYADLSAEEAYRRMRERIRRAEPTHALNTLADGRVVAAFVQPEATGGWVITHQDVTEREQLHALLAQQNSRLREGEEQLKAQNRTLDTAARASRRGHELLDAALNNMSQGLCMFDAERRLVVCNETFLDMYGFSADEAKPGTTSRELVEMRHGRGLYGNADAEQVVADWQADPSPDLTRIQSLSDGRIISVCRRRLANGGFVVTHEDITARHRLEQNEREARELLSAVLDAAPAAIVCLAVDGRVVVWSRGAERMFGYSAAETIGRPYPLVPEGKEEEFQSLFRRAIAGEIFRDTHVQRRRKDGTLVEVNFASAATYNHDGTVRGIAYVLSDITDSEKLRMQLERQHSLLKSHEEKLRTKNVQLDAALNNMVQGVAMFDAGRRLVICNSRYAEMYDLSSDQLVPGTPLQTILDSRQASGAMLVHSAEQLTQAMLEDRGQVTTELSDGRFISVSVQAMADGGMLTTHQDITEQRRSEAKIVHMALHDTLTELPNRVLLNERLEHALTRVKRGEVVAILILDLDYFKSVNDTLGHAAGDKLLQMVAERLRGLVRETDTVARMGGDEFAILQVAIGQPSDATSLAHRVIEVVSRPYDLDGHQVVIGTSVGIAVGPADGLTPDQLTRNADLALYRAKDEGRGTFCFFEPEMDAQMQARRAMEYDLRKALVANEFELYYQPVVNLGSREITGMEALIRWHHPKQGMILPAMFIPLAEEIGFIVPLGDWALREACAAAANWPQPLAVSVNISPAQFRSPGLLQNVIGALAASGLPPVRLELEITETVLLGDGDATLATLYQLRDLGVRVAMDDFGTGYSSLSYLQSFPFDKIKIDRSFIKDITEGVGSLNIVRAVTAMAQGLGMTTTAEGVETNEQLEAVRSEGCTEMQGFLFSHPLPAEEAMLFLRRRSDGRTDAATGKSAA